MSRKTAVAATTMLMMCSAGVYAGHTNTVLVTDLAGTEEVDDADPTNRLPGDPDGSGEAYVFGIDGDPTTLCYLVLVDDIQLVPVGMGMAAHIHEGDRFANGPVVATLAGPEDSNAADCLTEGEEGKFPTGEAGIVQRILNNPERFYINVHNPDYPAGAIRGNLQFQLEDDHSHDGDEGAPSTPVNIVTSIYSATAAELMWERSTDDGLVLSYRVYIDGERIADVEGPSYFTNDLELGISYMFSLEAVDQEGNVSERSAEVIVRTQ